MGECKQAVEPLRSFPQIFLKNKVLQVGLVLLVKVVLYFLFINGNELPYAGGIFIDSADRSEYLTPIDNYIESGSYSLKGNGEPYAGRLPGFVFPYLLFRLLFDEQLSNALLGCFIVFMSLFATIKLIAFLDNLTGSFMAVMTGVLSLEVIPYFWHWDWVLHPNSLSASCLILGICYLYRYFSMDILKDLLFSGFFLAWLFMLRGVTFLIIPVSVLVLFIHMRRSSKRLKQALAAAGVFILPFLVVECIWITRNFMSLNKFIPLQTSFVPGSKGISPEYGYNSHTKFSMLELREFINCWGGDNFWYFKDADMSWFVSAEDRVPAKDHFKDVVFDSGITAAELDALKSDIVYSFRRDLSQSEHDSVESAIASKSNVFTERFKKNNPGYFYFMAPFNRVANLVLKNPVQDWPGPSFGEAGPVKKGLKMLSFLMYGLTLACFIIFLVWKWKLVYMSSLYLLLTLYTVSILLTFAFIINAAHYVYFIFGYIPAVIMNICLGTEVFRKLYRPSLKTMEAAS